MNSTFILSEIASQDIADITNYIADRNPSAAIKMLEKLKATCQTLAENPELGEIRKGFGVPGCRSFTVGRYVIFYRPNGNGIEVARLLHSSRDL